MNPADRRVGASVRSDRQGTPDVDNLGHQTTHSTRRRHCLFHLNNSHANTIGDRRATPAGHNPGSSSEWTPQPPLRHVRAGLGAVMVEGHILAIGGFVG